MATTQDIKKWYKNCKSKLIKGFNGKCCVCGYDRCIDAFDFHHIDPLVKEFNISGYKVKNWDKIKAEAHKCVLLCAVCHRELHAGIIQLPDPLILFNEDLIPKEEKKKHICIECGDEVSTKNVKICINCHIKKTKKLEISKEELELLVNEMPLTKIAIKFGVTDKTIEKRCRKLNIQLKGRGYWSKR